MKTLFSSILLLLVTISTAQFKIPKKVDWEIANTKPILLLQLPDSDPNAQIFNSNLKKYVEQYFGASRISQYLQPKEFEKVIRKNKKEFIFIGYKYNKSGSTWFTQIYLGINDVTFMINGGYLSSVNFEDKSKFLKSAVKQFTEADIKFAIASFKNQIDYGVSHDDLSFSEMRKNGSKTPAELNPSVKELSNLTLLIDKNLVGEKFVKEFTSTYKYKFEFVESSRIEQAILNNERNFAFVYEYCQPTANGNFATLLYIYKGDDLSNIFAYFPNSSGIGYVELVKGIASNYGRDYANTLNESIK
ncbi:hypothetical protein M9Q43_02010 [Flavobacterium sp. HXWNR29]|uniref:hypothetical protein n=1 Tax=Flavobacterium odoriferum TaxID=2946604 RepID=UPI0021CB6270|nr:hypothetical protein [Flavobacterium sp. HXWNR29]MCU4187935.1 hypothetical protein [Flavobacterium sp. HXWNR29]